MAKFRFRLQPLLRLRQLARDQRRAELAQAYQAEAIVAEQQRRLDQLCKRLTEDQARAVGPGPVNVERLLEYRRYELLVRGQEKQLEHQRQLVSKEIERRQQAVVEADRQVRVLERLRERQQQRHNQQEQRREIKQIDEAAQLRYLREVEQ